MNYDDIKRVFSIWIHLGMKENVLNHVHLAEDSLLGGYHSGAGLGLLNIVLIGLAEELPDRNRKGCEARGIVLREACGVAKSEERIILSMRKKGYPLDQIAAIMEKTVEEVKVVIEESEKKTLV